MTELSQLTLAIAAVAAMLGLPALLAPAWLRRQIVAFPRNIWAGRILTAIGVSWTACLLKDSSMAWFEPFKPWLYVAAPAAFFLIVLFMDELLAARALGGVLLLAASPVLDAARWHGSASRLVLVALVYVWVVAGMALMLGPYRFRRCMEFFIATSLRLRLLGAAALALGAVLAALGLTVFEAPTA
jgi:hypothetical protein